MDANKHLPSFQRTALLLGSLDANSVQETLRSLRVIIALGLLPNILLIPVHWDLPIKSAFVRHQTKRSVFPVQLLRTSLGAKAHHT